MKVKMFRLIFSFAASSFLLIPNSYLHSTDGNLEDKSRCWITHSTHKFGNHPEIEVEVRFNPNNPCPNIILGEKNIHLSFTDGSYPELLAKAGVNTHYSVPEKLMARKLFELLHEQYYDGNLNHIKIHFYDDTGVKRIESTKEEIRSFFWKTGIFDTEFLEKVFK